MSETAFDLPPAPSGLGAFSLFVIPHSARLAYVWCPLPAGAVIAEVRFADATAHVHSRKRLIRPHHSLEVLLIEAPELRDGAPAELTVTSAAHGPQTVQAQARLARWDDADTSRVLKFIATRFRVDGDAPHVLDRYLNYTSAWQGGARLVQAFPDGHLIDIDIESDDADLDAYVVTEEGLRSSSIRPVSIRNGAWTVWRDGPVQDFYLDVAGDLVRVSPKAGRFRMSRDPAAATADERMHLAEALHQRTEQPSAALGQWVSGLCQRHARVALDGGTLEVRTAVRLPTGDLAVFISVSGAVSDLHSFSLQPFGQPDAVVTTHVRAVDAADGGEWRQQILIVASGISPDAACYRLTWLNENGLLHVWIRETSAAHPTVPVMLRDFVPVATLHAHLFERVVHPLATMGDARPRPSLSHRIDVGSREGRAAADIFVFVDHDLEALHRTILGLSLTSSQPVNIYLCLFDQTVLDKLISVAQQWADLYAVALQIRCYTSRASEACVIAHEFEGALPRVFCRAGAVPRQADWLPAILQQLEAGHDSIVLGTETGSPLGRDLTLSPTDLRAVLETDQQPSGFDLRIKAAAVAPSLAVGGTRLRRLFTFEAFVLRQAVCGLRPGQHACVAETLNFIQTASNHRPDTFQTKLDAYSLRESLQLPERSKRRVRIVPRRS